MALSGGSQTLLHIQTPWEDFRIQMPRLHLIMSQFKPLGLHMFFNKTHHRQLQCAASNEPQTQSPASPTSCE